MKCMNGRLVQKRVFEAITLYVWLPNVASANAMSASGWLFMSGS
jgi:hypothetical protein